MGIVRHKSGGRAPVVWRSNPGLLVGKASFDHSKDVKIHLWVDYSKKYSKNLCNYPQIISTRSNGFLTPIIDGKSALFLEVILGKKPSGRKCQGSTLTNCPVLYRARLRRAISTGLHPPIRSPRRPSLRNGAEPFDVAHGGERSRTANWAKAFIFQANPNRLLIQNDLKTSGENVHLATFLLTKDAGLNQPSELCSAKTPRGTSVFE